MTTNSKMRAAREALARAEAATGANATSTETEPVQNEERAERERNLRLFHWFASRAPLGRRFNDSVELGLWCVKLWRDVAVRELTEVDRERFAQVASDMWAAIEHHEETGAPAPNGHGPILLDAFYRAWRLHRLGRSA